jgi:hypothetical protein
MLKRKSNNFSMKVVKESIRLLGEILLDSTVPSDFSMAITKMGPILKFHIKA